MQNGSHFRANESLMGAVSDRDAFGASSKETLRGKGGHYGPFAVRTASSDTGPGPSMDDLLRGKGSNNLPWCP